MKKYTLLMMLVGAIMFAACEEEEPAPYAGEDELQVAMYSSPDVYEEAYNHHTRKEEKIKLDYNRQVFVDLDALSETVAADTLGIHKSSDDFTEFDLWEEGKDVAEGMEGWDIVFSQYNGRVDDGTGTGALTAYSVTGVLLNKGVTSAVKVTDIDYSNITVSEVEELTLSTEVDVIGHAWKQLDFSTFLFEIVANEFFVIKTTDGMYFKLAFTSFYNDEGVKGFPKFKFERILK
ncbi:HmuY family protein [Reichenbachiella versicolor]|uniref:HmuY family protein n=1 Tax=Reichenbachiella versicolor TaxID=1821036 RepID=UPI000D6E9C39|nr:HmuY family protein [Reichenbachiella versicolor]